MYDQLLQDIEKQLHSKPRREDGLAFVCQRLHDELEKYNWVGYYLHSQEKPELYPIMDGNIAATVFAVIHILWVLPVGYFTLLGIMNR